MKRCSECGHEVDKNYKIDIRRKDNDGVDFLIKEFGKQKSLAGGANFRSYFDAFIAARNCLSDLSINPNEAMVFFGGIRQREDEQN